MAIEVIETGDVDEAVRREGQPMPSALPDPAAARHGRLPRHAHSAGGRPGALGQARQRHPLRRAPARPRRLARRRARRARARRPLRRRRHRLRRPDAEGAGRLDPDPRPGRRAGPDRRLRDRGALPRRADRAAARRGRGDARARGAHPERPALVLGDHRADPVPARGAPARGHQHRGPVRADAPDRRRPADRDRPRSRSSSRRSTSPSACGA